ncbi:uncharacterized protein LOC134984633 [Pseudophryne corroboree]|uniref:uncharacterized protein LOC134984632 n=1 Tax=Pseudophryne corroboree TaxID=495146 RepID=UPI003081CCC4
MGCFSNFSDRLNRRQGYLSKWETPFTNKAESRDDLKEDFFKLEDLLKSEVRHWLDTINMQKYIDRKIIPRGLRLSKPSIFHDNVEYQKRWDSTLDRCSLTLMGIVIDYRTEKLKIIESEIGNLKEKLEPHSQSSEFKERDMAVTERVNKFEQTILETKCKKFQRDVEDYRTDNVRTFKQFKNSNFREPPNNYNKSVSQYRPDRRGRVDTPRSQQRMRRYYNKDPQERFEHRSPTKKVDVGISPTPKNSDLGARPKSHPDSSLTTSSFLEQRKRRLQDQDREWQKETGRKRRNISFEEEEEERRRPVRN